MAAASLFGAFIALRIMSVHIARTMGTMASQIWAISLPREPSTAWAMALFRQALSWASICVLPVMLLAVIAGVAVSLCQVGVFFRANVIIPDFNRINPVSGAKRLFSRRSLVNCFKSILKIILVAIVAWSCLRKVWPEMCSLILRDIPDSVLFTKSVIERLLTNCCIFLLIVGVIDYVYQWWEHERSIMMTFKEIKDEMRDLEGKPEVKQAIKSRQRQIARRRMMQDVPSADVVVVNPTHYAVALKYDIIEYPAPRVVAKGLDHIALNRRKLAEENKVCVVENPLLAKSLYKAVDIGELIPRELYQAVAEVLAYVYKLSGKNSLEGAVR